MSRPYDVVFFDMGQTLVEYARPVMSVWSSVLGALGCRRTPDELELASERVASRFPWPSRPPQGVPDDATAFERFERDAHRLLLEEIGFDGDVPAAVDALWDCRVGGAYFDPYPDAVGVLSELAARGYRLGIISNWDVVLERTVSRLGLGEHFDAVVSSAHVGYLKPHPGIFEAALAGMGVPAHRAAHVGDQYEADILGARGAGLDAYWIVRGEPDRSYERTVASLSALARLLP